MAVNESRSMNDDLLKGVTDGIVKKAAPDRGGEVEYHPVARNLLLEQSHHGPSFSLDGEHSTEAARRITTVY